MYVHSSIGARLLLRRTTINFGSSPLLSSDCSAVTVTVRFGLSDAVEIICVFIGNGSLPFPLVLFVLMMALMIASSRAHHARVEELVGVRRRRHVERRSRRRSGELRPRRVVAFEGPVLHLPCVRARERRADRDRVPARARARRRPALR